MGATDTWGAVQLSRRKTSWAASVGRKRVAGFRRILIVKDAEWGSEHWAPGAEHITASQRLRIVRRLIAESLDQPPTTEERLRQTEARIQSLSAGINETLQTMINQTEEAIRMVQERRAKWQCDVVAEKHK